MDYDSARHHYESLQTAKKKDEAKIAKVRAGAGAGAGAGNQREVSSRFPVVDVDGLSPVPERRRSFRCLGRWVGAVAGLFLPLSPALRQFSRMRINPA